MGKQPGTPAPARKALGPNLYWRGKIIWGRVKIGAAEYRSSLRTASPREAAQRLEQWRVGLEQSPQSEASVDPHKVGHSYADAVVRWAKEVLPGAVKPSVMRRYLTSVAVLDPVFRSMRVSDIDERAISRYISSRSGQVANATIRRDITALSKLLSACIVWGWIDRNPARSYDRSIIKEQKRALVLPAAGDIAYFLEFCPKHTVPLIRFLLATGMRENEAVTLSSADIDFKGRTITLTRTKSNRPRRLNWKTHGGNASDILHPLQDCSLEVLFPNRDGRVYANFASNFVQVMRAVVIRAEDERIQFRRWRAHDLRHLFAVRWLQAGGDIYRLSRHLGHSSVKTTEIYLDHLTEDEMDAVRGVAQKGAHIPEVAQ